MDRLGHEWMVLLGKHEVVGYANWDRPGKDDGEGEQRVDWALAANVNVHVDTTIMVEDEVADGVGTLDGVLVRVKGIEEPGVLGRDELARAGVCPEHVLAVGE